MKLHQHKFYLVEEEVLQQFDEIELIQRFYKDIIESYLNYIKKS